MPWRENDKHQFPSSRAIGLWPSVLCTTALNNIMQIRQMCWHSGLLYCVTKPQWKAKRSHTAGFSALFHCSLSASQRGMCKTGNTLEVVTSFFSFFFSFYDNKVFFPLHCYPEWQHQFFSELYSLIFVVKITTSGNHCCGLIHMIKSEVSDRMENKLILQRRGKIGMFHENMKASFVPPSSRPAHLPSQAPEV